MNAQDHSVIFQRQLREIFDHAIEISDIQSRKSYVESACQSDLALKARIERLLQSHELAGNYLETPLDPGAQDLVSHLLPLDETRHKLADNFQTKVAPSVGEEVGAYLLTERIGEGGFGIVFSGVHKDITNRKVAIKVLKPEMDTRHVIARFNRERLSLSVMNHPGIARIYEAGTTEHGLPYFIMELVNGTSITQYCDEHKLTVAQRIELLLVVCNSIAHAHLKGVIHRDLKPTNILVEHVDGMGMPRVIDFGISKTSELVCGNPSETGGAQLMGTPLYMSPEQASFDNYDIDVRADVYALGVLLFELVSGSPPALEPGVDERNVGQILRRTLKGINVGIRQRLNSLDASSRSEICSNRTTSFERLIHTVSDDLESVAAKAIETDRDLRYESVAALANDLRNILSNAPVEARPASVMYHAKKFCQRNKGGVLLASLAFVSLFTASVFSIWFVLRAHRAELLAEAAIAEKRVALVAERLAVSAKQEKQKNIESTYTLFSKLLLATNEDPDVTLAEALLDNRKTIDQAFHENPVLRDKLLRDASEFLSNHGYSDEVVGMLEERLKIQLEKWGPRHVITLEVKSNLANERLNRGELKESMAIAQQVFDAVSQESNKHLVDLRCRNLNLLARIHQAMGQLEEAIEKFEQGYALGTEKLGPQSWVVLQNSATLVNAYLRAGQYAKAKKQLRETQQTAQETFSMDHFVNVSLLTSASSVYLAEGDVELSLKAIRDAVHYSGISNGRNHKTYAQHLQLNAKVEQKAGNLDHAIELNERALEILEKEGNASPQTLAIAYHSIAINWAAKGNKKKQIQFLEKACAISSTNFHDSDWKYHLETKLAYTKKDQDLAMSVKSMEEITDRMKAHVGKKPAGIIHAMLSLSHLYSLQERFDKEKEVLYEALEISRGLKEESYSASLQVLAYYGKSLQRRGKFDQCYSLIDDIATNTLDYVLPRSSSERIEKKRKWKK